MSPILAFGDDRSAGADTCWDWIIGQQWEGWRLEVITADAPADMRPASPEDAELHFWAPEEPRRPIDCGFTTVEHLRAEIDPRVALIARRWDLVAVGARGKGLLKRLHLGSTADWLMRQPTSPLVIARQSGRVQRALVASDGSPHSKRAIDVFASLPWIEGVEVTVVLVDDGRIDRKAALAGASDTLSGAGARIEAVTRSGDTSSVIVEEIESAKPDLIVMGARGRGGVSRLVLGSTAAAVAGSCDRSILVAHAASEE